MLPELSTNRILVKERDDRKMASEFIETLTSLDVYTPAHCAVVEVVASAMREFPVGSLVVIAAGDIANFLLIDGKQLISIPPRAVQAHYSREGTLIPNGRRIVCKKDSEIMRHFAFGAESPILMPSIHGLSSSGDKQPNKDGRTSDVQTVLYSPVIAKGPECRKDIRLGDVVIFSPTVDVAELLLKGQTYHVVDSRDVEGRWPQS